MKLTNANIAVIMVAVVGLSAGITFAFTAEVDFYGKPNPANGAMMLTGNVKVTHIDGEGNVIGYRQTDNHIVGQGMELILAQVFGDINLTANYDVGEVIKRPIRFMGIGHNGEYELLMNDTNTRDPAINNVASCERVRASFANVSNGVLGFGDGSTVKCSPSNEVLLETGGADSADCSAQANVTATGTFTGLLCNDPVLDIDEAGMFTEQVEGAGLMFARNNFGGVVLNMPDTLRLDWEFTFTDS